MLHYFFSNFDHMSAIKTHNTIYMCFPGGGEMGCVFERSIWSDFKNFLFGRLDNLERKDILQIEKTLKSLGTFVSKISLHLLEYQVIDDK